MKKMKKHYLILLILVAMLAITSCTPKESADNNSDSVELMKLTIEELSSYNGEDGQPAYVAIDGIIYDVSGLPSWTGGTHNGNMSGQDLSEAINDAPHGDSKLKGLTVVGELIE